MIPKQIQFTLEKREHGVPWVLFAKIDNANPWAIIEWEKPPKDSVIEDTKKICLRSCEVYHRHIHFPSFCMQEMK